MTSYVQLLSLRAIAPQQPNHQGYDANLQRQIRYSLGEISSGERLKEKDNGSNEPRGRHRTVDKAPQASIGRFRFFRQSPVEFWVNLTRSLRAIGVAHNKLRK